MNGVIIQANIISMMLDGRYIHEMPHWLVYLLAFLIGWVHIAVFIRYYIDKHIWFHLVAKIAQLVSAIFFVYLGLLCFDWFDLHLNMTLTIAIIVLAIDVIYFYEALMLWLHKKFNIKTIFTLNHHVA
jgi:CHASE2 domain-containing sensor protein